MQRRAERCLRTRLCRGGCGQCTTRRRRSYMRLNEIICFSPVHLYVMKCGRSRCNSWCGWCAMKPQIMVSKLDATGNEDACMRYQRKAMYIDHAQEHRCSFVAIGCCCSLARGTDS